MRKIIYRVRFTHKTDLEVYYLSKPQDDRYYSLGNIENACIFKTVDDAQRVLETAFFIEFLFNNYYVDFELDLE